MCCKRDRKCYGQGLSPQFMPCATPHSESNKLTGNTHMLRTSAEFQSCAGFAWLFLIWHMPVLCLAAPRPTIPELVPANDILSLGSMGTQRLTATAGPLTCVAVVANPEATLLKKHKLDTHLHEPTVDFDPRRANCNCHSSIWHIPVALEGTVLTDSFSQSTWNKRRWEASNSQPRRLRRRAPLRAQVELDQSCGSCP